MADINIDAYVKKVLDVVKDSPEKLKAAASNSDFLKKILGEDGKLGKEYLEKIAAAIKESAPVKALLGEDGKFTKEDFSRIAGEAKEAGEGLLNKAKDLIGK